MAKDMHRRITHQGYSGYLFYNNLGEIGDMPSQRRHWRNVGARASAYFNNVADVILPKNTDVSPFLFSMGTAEFEKEKKLLQDFFGMSAPPNWSIDNYPLMIQAINQVFNLNSTLSNIINEVDITRMKQITNNMQVVYKTYLEPLLNERILIFLRSGSTRQNLIRGRAVQFGQEFEKVINKAMDDALNNMINSSDEDSESAPWLTALKAINEVDSFRKSFHEDFFSRYGFEQLKRDITEQVRKGINLKKLLNQYKKEYKQTINSNLTDLYRSDVFGKQLEKAFQSIGVQSSGGFSISWGGSGTNYTKPFRSSHISISGEGILESNSVLDDYRALDNLSNFQKNVQNGITKMTIVYESSKFNVNDKSGEFSGTRNLNDLIPVLSEIGFSRAGGFISKIKQTIPGAILSNSGIQEQASEQLASAVAYFLFDDFKAIGKNLNSEKDNSVHILRFKNSVLPLSFLLLTIAQALADAERSIHSFVKVDFDLPDSVAYDYPQEDKSISASEQRWMTQRRIVEDESKVTLTFLSSFKDLIQQFL